MHAGAVLEDPANGAIQALYPGPGYPGSKYNGTGKVITARYCMKINCQVNMAVYNREQVGSSFKPYVLSAAVKQGMNVQTSTLDGYNNQCIPPDSEPSTYPVRRSSRRDSPARPAGYPVHNDSAAENGPYTPQIAMAVSINTAYADLWHTVGGQAPSPAWRRTSGWTPTPPASPPCGPDVPMQDEAGVALGQASLTVVEQATMLATIDNGGIYHNAHVITSITRNGAPPTPIKITSYPVFSSDPTLNAEQASQVQYAMSKDNTSYGTAPVAAMSNGQEIIAKTGTTNTAQSAFFIGAIPSQALAVAIFTNQQGKGTQTLDGLGGNSQGGFGGTWPATIWHTYAEDHVRPAGRRAVPHAGLHRQRLEPGPAEPAQGRKKHKKPDHGQNGGGQNGDGQGERRRQPQPVRPPTPATRGRDLHDGGGTARRTAAAVA